MIPDTIFRMLITPHVATGVAVGSLLPSPLLALLAGVVSHFLLDMIPHWDPDPRRRGQFAAFVAVDATLAGVVLLVSLGLYPESQTAILFAAFGAILPDVIENLGRILLGRAVPYLSRFHELIQPKMLDRGRGLILQVIYLAGLLAWLWR